MVYWRDIKRTRHWLRSLSFACNDPLGSACLVRLEWIPSWRKGFIVFTASDGGVHSYWHHYISALGFNLHFPPCFHSSHPPPASCSSFKMKVPHSASGVEQVIDVMLPRVPTVHLLDSESHDLFNDFHHQCEVFHWSKDFISSHCLIAFQQG